MRTRAFFALVIGLACAGCKPAPAAPGTGAFEINVVTSTITNQANRGVVVTLQQEGQSAVIGRACDIITSNSFTLASSAFTEIGASGGYCEQGAQKRFPAGRYSLTAGIFVPPRSPNDTLILTTTQSFTVTDHTTVTINGAALSRDSSSLIPLTILPATLPTLTVGVPVSIQLTVAGGTGTGLTWSPSTTGSQIAGLFISIDGVLSGTPTTAGPYTRGFTVVDSGGNTGSIVYTGTVNAR